MSQLEDSHQLSRIKQIWDNLKDISWFCSTDRKSGYCQMVLILADEEESG